MEKQCKKYLPHWLRAFVFVLPSLAHAQAPDLEWQRCLGGSLTEFAYGIQATADGGAVVTGFTESNDGDASGSHGSRDIWLTKVDAEGAFLWQHCYGGTGSEMANGLVIMADGGFLLFGGTGSSDGDVECIGGGNVWLLKTDAGGVLEWQTCLGGTGDNAFAATATPDGGAVVVGGTFSTDGLGQGNHGQMDFFAVKINSVGEVEWSQCYGGSFSDVARAIRQTMDGGYIIGGSTDSSDGDVTAGEFGRGWIIKIGAEGTLEWNRRLGGIPAVGQNDQVNGVVQTPEGEYLITCGTNANDGDVIGNHGDGDAWLIRLDSSGAIVSQHCFGGSGEDTGRGITAVGDGHYIIAGYAESDDGDVSGNHGSADVWVFMIDVDLNLLWQKCLGGTDGDLAYAIARTQDNGTMITGRTQSNDGDVSGNHGGAADVWVAKLGPDPSSVGEEQEGQPFVIYPSPVNDLLNVSLPEAATRSMLDVLDITGRVVLHRQVERGAVTLQLSVQNFAEGSYCVRLSSGSEVFAKRFVRQ